MAEARKSRTERKKEETRKKIVAVAMELFNRQGFDRTTVDRIAAEADVARGTVFNHFPVKEAIVGEYLRRAVSGIEAQAVPFYQSLPDTRTRLATAFRLTLEWSESHLNRDLYERYFVYRMQTVIQSVRDPGLRSGFARILSCIMKLGQEAGELRLDIGPEELADHLDWAWASGVIVWLAQPDKFTADIVIDRMVDMFLNGARSGRQGENAG
ncbi:MAG: TetR/AcrR family transcriptional regulator [Peptococcaceae bacterium]|jgi:AcrR family transcriptional regulator|nr:TetR/AcrR family transcriptional regulator [Peptococcaceae bacterium]